MEEEPTQEKRKHGRKTGPREEENWKKIRPRKKENWKKNRSKRRGTMEEEPAWEKRQEPA